jgi:hypothetical protein
MIKRCVEDDKDTSVYYEAAAYAADIPAIYYYLRKRDKSGWQASKEPKRISMQQFFDSLGPPLLF